MAIVKPFRAIRPSHDKVHLVASRSYISYNKRDLESKLRTNPYSFIHIINPEFGKPKKARANSKELFTQIRVKFEEFLEEGIFLQEEKKSFYIYQQITENHSITGIIGLASTTDYAKDRIKKHEQTLSKREAVFCEYLKTCDIHAEPVLLSYPDNNWLSTFMKKETSSVPVYDFSTSNKVRHKLWQVKDPEKILMIQNSFAEVPNLYIADGHHRSASSYLLSQQGQMKEDHPYNFFLSYFVPESQLKIFEFNRLIKDLNDFDHEEFISRIKNHFHINEKREIFKPKQKGQFSLYLDSKWYELNLINSSEQLDSEVLNELILGPILGIQDLRKDKRVSFIGGQNASIKMQKQVDTKKFKAAFGLFPVSIDELKFVADNNLTMPPKSTYIEPKLRSGLTIYAYSK